MAVTMGVSFDDYIRTTEERHKVSCAELWQRIDASGNIYLGHYEGWYAVRDEAFYDEDELTTRAGRQQGGAERRAGGVGEGAFVFLPAVSLAGQAAEAVRRRSGLHPAGRPAQRGAELRARRAARPVDQPHQLQLGHPGAGRARPCDVCLAGCAEQLRHRLRLSRTRPHRAGAIGRPMRISSARTSCASTRSIGRRS